MFSIPKIVLVQKAIPCGLSVYTRFIQQTCPSAATSEALRSWIECRPSPGRDRVLVPRPRDCYRRPGRAATEDEYTPLGCGTFSRRARTRALPDLHPALARGWRCFQGGSSVVPNPGLKPWAALSDYFMVKKSVDAEQTNDRNDFALLTAYRLRLTDY
jgi:hypothetical protein